MDAATGKETTNEALTDRILAINFGAIHTSSMVMSILIFILHIPLALTLIEKYRRLPMSYIIWLAILRMHRLLEKKSRQLFKYTAGLKLG